eukprot:scaffold886_cov174-Ochromonas_danica.AAC.10
MSGLALYRLPRTACTATHLQVVRASQLLPAQLERADDNSSSGEIDSCSQRGGSAEDGEVALQVALLHAVTRCAVQPGMMVGDTTAQAVEEARVIGAGGGGGELSDHGLAIGCGLGRYPLSSSSSSC